MSLKKLSGETLVYGLSSILGRLLNFVLVTPFITRVLSDAEVGEVGNLMFWTAFLIAALVFRMDTAVFRFASRNEYDPRAVFRQSQRVVMLMTALLIVPLLLLSDRVAEYLEAPEATTYVRLVLITVAFDALSAVPLARLRLQQRAWFFVMVNLGNVVINIVLIYYLLAYLPSSAPAHFVDSFKVGYYLIAIAAAAGLRYLVLVLDGLFGPIGHSEPSPKVLDRVKTTEQPVGAPALGLLFRYSLPLTVVSIAGIANSLVGPSLLTGAGADAAAGHFTAALRMAVFLNLFITAYQYAAEPYFFRQSGSDLETADRTIYADAMRAYGIVGTLASAAILLALPWLQFFIGADVRPGLVVLPILLAANFCFGIYSNLSIAYKLTDQTHYGALIVVAGSAFAVGLPVVFIGRYGIFAPAFGMLLCFLVMCALAYQVSRKYFPVDYPFGRLFLYALIAAVTCYLGTFSEAMWWRIVLLLVTVAALGLLEWRWLIRTFGRGTAGGT